MLNLAATAPRLPRACSRRGKNGSLPRTAALCAVLAAIIVLTAVASHPLAHADGGASARNQTAAPAPDQTPATPQAYAQRILRLLSDRHTNNWVRYWQARADCQAAPAAHDAAPIDRVLLTLTAAICAQIDARIGVNPADHPPRGDKQTGGLLLNEPDAATGYTLFTGYKNSDVFLIDPLGRIAHSWHPKVRFYHAKLLDNGNLLATVQNSVIEFDPRGNIVWRHRVGRRLHHDFLKMPNGNVMLIVEGRKTREEAIAAGANPEFVHENGLRYDYLLEARPTDASGGEAVWEWSPWDHLVQDFDPSKPNYGTVAEHPELIDINFLLETISERRQGKPNDWLHSNAIDYNPQFDQIMLSSRHFSELWIIDRSATMEEARGHSGGNSGMGGDLLYRWGNPRAYGQGDSNDQRLFWQHQTHWIPPGLPGAGNILAFNNGNEFSGYKRRYSSMDEIAPPVDGYGYRRAEGGTYPPDELAWTYYAETPSDFYAPIWSGAQRLPNGNTLIVDGPAGAIFQVTPDGKLAWKYVAPLHRDAHPRQADQATQTTGTFATPYDNPVHSLNNDVYRAYWYPPDYPGLQALDLTPGAYIEDLPDIRGGADEIAAALAAGDFGEPLARSDFDIYLDQDNRRIIYIKRPCAADDARAKFFLHITPSDTRDLPDHKRERGFDDFDFNFDGGEVQASDNWCVATQTLPRYPIARISTGQFTDKGALWRADVDLSE